MSITVMRAHRRRAVADVMSSEVVSVRDTDTYKHIVAVLQASRITAVPVVSAGGSVLGIVSESDLILKQEGEVPARGVHPLTHHRKQSKVHQVYAADLMTSPVVAVKGDCSIGEAARMMERHGVKRLVVLDGNARLLGIVTRSDLLKVFLRGDAGIRDEIFQDIIQGEMRLDTQGLDVTVVDGRVNVSGEVELRSDIERLVRLVYEVDGVVDVNVSLDFRVDDVVIGPYVGAMGAIAGVRGQ